MNPRYVFTQDGYLRLALAVYLEAVRHGAGIAPLDVAEPPMDVIAAYSESLR